MAAQEHASAWASWLPLAVLALVMLLRLRNLNRARPLRKRALLVLPIVYVLIVAATLWLRPPSALGWLCGAGGVVLGALAGWQRARLMRLHVDGATGAVMMRQSPAALILLVVIVGLRRLFVPTEAVDLGAPMPAEALLATDALLGFALGMIVAQRLELWRRARQVGAPTG